jgi:hypothetical protein
MWGMTFSLVMEVIPVPVTLSITPPGCMSIAGYHPLPPPPIITGTH